MVKNIGFPYLLTLLYTISSRLSRGFDEKVLLIFRKFQDIEKGCCWKIVKLIYHLGGHV